MNPIDVVIIGAGIAGLTCAQVLQQAGYRVAIVEKSRGVGGRLATRRLHDTRADHGTCYLSPRGEVFQALVDRLLHQGVLQIWTDCVYGLSADGNLQAPPDRAPRYVAADGMNAIAKFLAAGLDIRLNQRAVGLELTQAQTWRLLLEDATDAKQSYLEAKAAIVTAPAPQAVQLLEPLAGSVLTAQFLAQLRSVEFTPCLAVMAGYEAALLDDWQQIYFEVKAIAPQHPDLAWIGLDSSKRPSQTFPVFVVQSTAPFAQMVLAETDLMSAGQQLLEAAAALLAPWLRSPTWMQVHRWRYSFPCSPLTKPHLAADSVAPLICAGDWCGGMRVESALLSGLETAHYLNGQLESRTIAPSHFWEAIAH